MVSPIIQATFQLLLMVAVSHLSSGETHAAAKKEFGLQIEANEAPSTENIKWRIVREARRNFAKDIRNKQSSNNKSEKNGKVKQIISKLFDDKKREKSKREKTNKRNLKKKSKESKKKSRTHKRKFRQYKKKSDKKYKNTKKGMKKHRRNKKQSKEKKKKQGKPVFKQSCDAAVMLQKNRDYGRIGNNLRQLRRIERRCEIMERKAIKSTTLFVETVAALNETIRSECGATEESIIIRDQLILCPSTIKHLCQKSSVVACQHDELLATCEPELQKWITLYVKCFSAPEGYCACISALPALDQLTAKCLQMSTLEKEVIASKRKCTSSSEEGSYGYCRKLQIQASEEGPESETCPTSTSGVTAPGFNPSACPSPLIAYIHGPQCHYSCPNISICCYAEIWIYNHTLPINFPCCFFGNECPGPITTPKTVATTTAVTTTTTMDITTTTTNTATTTADSSCNCSCAAESNATCKNETFLLAVTAGMNNINLLKSSEEIITAPVQCTLQNIPDLPIPTTAGESVYIPQMFGGQTLLFCGGSTRYSYVPNQPVNTNWTATNSCYTYTPNFGPGTTWAPTTPMRKERAWFSLTAVNDKEIIAAGGMDNSGNLLDSLEKFDISTKTWTIMDIKLFDKMYGHCAVHYDLGRASYLIIIGGSLNKTQHVFHPNTARPYVIKINLNDLTQTPVWPGSMPGRWAPACTIKCNDIFVSGGAIVPTTIEEKRNGGAATTGVFRFDITGRTTTGFELQGNLTQQRWGHTMGISNGELVVAGGYDQNGQTYLTSIEDSNNDGTTWIAKSDGLSTGRVYHAMASIPENANDLTTGCPSG